MTTTFVRDAIAKGLRPSRTKSDTLILRDGKKHRVLLTQDGEPTVAGKAFQNQSGETLPKEGFDTEQIPFRKGNSEYILKNGQEKLTRTYDSVSNDWKYTGLGRKFYAKKISYIVKIPASFSGTRSNGEAYTRQGFYTLDNPLY